MMRDSFIDLNLFIENKVKMIVATTGYYAGDIMDKTSSSLSNVGKTEIDDLSNPEYDNKILLKPDAAHFFNTSIDSIHDNIHMVGNQLKTVNKPYLDTHLFNSMNRTNVNENDAVPNMTDNPIQTPCVR